MKSLLDMLKTAPARTMTRNQFRRAFSEDRKSGNNIPDTMTYDQLVALRAKIEHELEPAREAIREAREFMFRSVDERGILPEPTSTARIIPPDVQVSIDELSAKETPETRAAFERLECIPERLKSILNAALIPKLSRLAKL